MTGLSTAEADARLRRDGPNALGNQQQYSALKLALRQFTNPLVLVLLVVSVIALLLHEVFDATMVLVMVAGSTLLGFTQEYLADHAVARLKSRVAVLVQVVRSGQLQRIPAANVVTGDVVMLEAGSMVPADGPLLSSTDLLVDQASLTGESFPVEKQAADTMTGTSAGVSVDWVYMGSSVLSGSGILRVAATGTSTRYGKIAGGLSLATGRSAFEQGLHSFGTMLARLMVAMVLAVVAVHLLLHRPGVESLLFAAALAVGLTPELLPAILSVTLAQGARRMARSGVIVRRLDAIENLGSMDVLCTDKTGTLTLGAPTLLSATDARGQEASLTLLTAAWNAALQSATQGPLDRAIIVSAEAAGLGPNTAVRVDEIPYDFSRKCVSVVVDHEHQRWLATKGAVAQVLERCTHVLAANALPEPLDDRLRQDLEQRFKNWSMEGLRVLAVARKAVPLTPQTFHREDEHGLCLLGFLLFADPPRTDAAETLAALRNRGVQVKLVTGDNRHSALAAASAVGLAAATCLTGEELRHVPEQERARIAAEYQVFAEMEPDQKRQLIRALQAGGHVVGFLGDGINDALALHVADVGISVNSAMEVAKDAADFVLLEKSLQIVCLGMDEGRRTYANTLKYLLTTISANFGNMLSMAVASAYLPFLPLLASQVLLNNLLSDIPATAIAGDRVDAVDLARPRHWDNAFIRRYMVFFGLVSSLFDFLAFALLLNFPGNRPEQFRTGWFLESLLTELCVALVVRTRGPCWQSRPGNWLLLSSVVVGMASVVLPWTSLGAFFGLVPLPGELLATIGLLTLAYLVAVETGKHWFYRHLRQR